MGSWQHGPCQLAIFRKKSMLLLAVACFFRSFFFFFSFLFFFLLFCLWLLLPALLLRGEKRAAYNVASLPTARQRCLQKANLCEIGPLPTNPRPIQSVRKVALKRTQRLNLTSLISCSTTIIFQRYNCMTEVVKFWPVSFRFVNRAVSSEECFLLQVRRFRYFAYWFR